jgi:integrase/recombinase XerD
MGYSVSEVNTNTTCAREAAEDSSPASFLYDREGNRKYLTRVERRAFLAAASHMPPEVRTFCLTLAYTGARISEVLALTPKRIDASARIAVVESLKKRRRGVFRAIPIPLTLISELDRVHAIETARQLPDLAKVRIWKFCRTTAWKWVKACLREANIVGPLASPKGLRHAFGVDALQAGVPINLVKKWLGHARLETTEVYTNAVGDEEQAIAARFWLSF